MIGKKLHGHLSQAEIVDHYNNGAGKYYASSSDTTTFAQAPSSDFKPVSYKLPNTTNLGLAESPLQQTTTIASFTYDGDGRQVKAVVGSTTTYYIGSHYQIDDGVVTKYYFAGAQRVAMHKNGTLYYLLSDHLGSTSITTNTSGVVVAELRYKAWGETRYSSGTTPTSYRYTGQREEASFGLYFYNARWFDPLIGRFAQADTIIPENQGVQAWDRYAYVSNNPIRYNDPTGHCGGLCVVGLVAGIVATPFVLSALGVTPDYIGADIARAVTGGSGDAVVTAGIAVQSQYPWALFTGSGRGWAQVKTDELGGQNPFSPSVAVEAMKNQINQAINVDCKLCQNGVDKLIVAAIAQNGYQITFGKLPLTSEGTINWDQYFESNIGSDTTDLFAKTRQAVTGMDYSSEFMVKLFMQDLRLLMKQGYELPEWASEEDVETVEKLLEN